MSGDGRAGKSTDPADDRPAAGAPPRWLAYLRIATVLVVGSVIVTAIVLLRQSTSQTSPLRRAQAAANSDATGTPTRDDGPLGAIETRAPVIGQPAPNFALLDMDGRRVELSSLQGRVVVVNFWATWCGPCREEFPELQKVAQELSGDVVVLALDQAESMTRVAAFRDQRGATFTILLDDTNSVADAWRLKGIPDTIFIGRDGVVRDVALGPLSAGSFRYRIQKVLNPR